MIGKEEYSAFLHPFYLFLLHYNCIRSKHVHFHRASSFMPDIKDFWSSLKALLNSFPNLNSISSTTHFKAVGKINIPGNLPSKSDYNIFHSFPDQSAVILLLPFMEQTYFFVGKRLTRIIGVQTRRDGSSYIQLKYIKVSKKVLFAWIKCLYSNMVQKAMEIWTNRGCPPCTRGKCSMLK